MYLYCSDCDVKGTIMWIKFGKKRKKNVARKEYEVYLSNYLKKLILSCSQF